MDLVEISIQVILQNQHPGGAYVASPNFPPYRYGWFRDGAYIAYAMDLYSSHESAERFFEWSSNIIVKNAVKINRAIAHPELVHVDYRESALHCRYTLEGEEELSKWSTHQLDGFGTWLWALIEHCKLSGNKDVPQKWKYAIDLVIDYIEALWSFPCADCWEENEDQIHTYTLASLAGGLQAFNDFSSNKRAGNQISLIMKFLTEHCLSPGGYFKKSVNLEGVDANLLGLVFPIELVPINSPLFLNTLDKIEADLHMYGNGVLRYLGDEYYGGGEWVLLAAWLGCVDLLLGRSDKAQKIKAWIEAQCDKEGMLPEQAMNRVQSKTYMFSWLQKWGPPAIPLLWSHAYYLILCHYLDQNKEEQ